MKRKKKRKKSDDCKLYLLYSITHRQAHTHTHTQISEPSSWPAPKHSTTQHNTRQCHLSCVLRASLPSLAMNTSPPSPSSLSSSASPNPHASSTPTNLRQLPSTFSCVSDRAQHRTPSVPSRHTAASHKPAAHAYSPAFGLTRSTRHVLISHGARWEAPACHASPRNRPAVM